MKKRILAILLAMALTLVMFAGCAQNPGTESAPAASSSPSSAESADTSAPESKPAGDAEPIKVAYITMSAANPYFVAVIDGMRAHADELGVEFSMTDPNSDTAQYITAMENYITNGVDVIIVSPLDENSLVPYVEKAHDKGIKVITLAQDIANADVKLAIDEYQYGFLGGQMAGEWINEKLGGQAEVCMLIGLNIEALVNRTNGLRDGITQTAPDAKIIAEADGNTRDKGVNAAETVLQAHPDCKVFAAENDDGALGAYQSVKSRGIADDTFYVGGMDATEEALQAMKEDGSFFRGSVDLHPKESGAQAIDIAVDLVNGKTPDEVVKAAGGENGKIFMQLDVVKQDSWK